MDPFYLNISPWMFESLNERECSECHIPIAKEFITGIGVREFKDKNILYLEHTCKKCGHKEITPVINKKKYSLEEMCYSILEAIQYQKSISISKNIEESSASNINPISKKEADAFIKFVRKVKNHDLFMDHISKPPTDDGYKK
jgi:hypothetical protein